MTDPCAPAQRMLEQLNEAAQFHRFGLAKIDYFKCAGIIVHRRDHAGDNIVDVGVIAPSGSVTKHRNGLSLVYEPGELVNRHVWPLPRSVPGKQPQANHSQSVEVTIDMAGGFSGDLCRRIGGDRISDSVVFSER